MSDPASSDQQPIKTAPPLPAAASEALRSEPDAKPAVQAKPEEPVEAYTDPKTNRAVDKIIEAEGDTVLAAEDAVRTSATPAVKPRGLKARWAALSKPKRVGVVALVLLIVVAGIPFTRYSLLGLVIKKPVTLTVVDSTAKTPVSNALVRLHGVSAKTNGEGKAKLRVPVGSAKLTISKQYYTEYSQRDFVGLSATVSQTIKLHAVGRRVPITIKNSITQQPLAGATIKILDTTAKTDKRGLATVVLPATASTRPASVSLAGYNTAAVTATVTDIAVPANNFTLTPSGQVYFLSNASGSIDVVKSNLDGTNRKTVLAGTGKEDARTTSLLASRDWKYVVLEARRDTEQPSLYIIDTTTDKPVAFESGDNALTLVGWYGHSFVYDVVRNGVSQTQAGHEILKSYNAELGQPNQLDQSQADGSNYQSFSNFYILDNLVAYTAQWSSSVFPANFGDKTDAIRGVQPSGQGKKDFQTFAASTTAYFDARLYEPQGLYVSVAGTDAKTSYYHLENQNLTPTTLSADAFNKAYPTFLLSPAGKQTFWSELRDGKNSLFVGDANAANSKQIASLSDYAPYGWYGDYLLVSKNASELYAMPTTGLVAGQAPLKITDYYKPAQTHAGYGYGYGGL